MDRNDPAQPRQVQTLPAGSLTLKGPQPGEYVQVTVFTWARAVQGLEGDKEEEGEQRVFLREATH